MTFPLDIAIQDIIDIQNNTKIGLIYGWTEYADIFEGTPRRRTEFCVKIEVVGDPHHIPQPQERTPSVLGFVAYGPYNAIDEDCFYKPGQVPVRGTPSTYAAAAIR